MFSIDQASDALARGDADEAYRQLAEADAGGSLPPEALPLLADAAYARGDVHATFEALERAHACALERGDEVAAAAAAAGIAMHLIIDTSLVAPVRAWAKRAESLLAERPDTPVHGQLAVVRAYERMFSGDAAAALPWARRAIEIAMAGRDVAGATFGRVCEARCLILTGQIDEGLEKLDEAAAVVASGEIDPVTAGLLFCEVVCAWQGLALHDRAAEWTELMEQLCRRHSALGSVHGRCRVHRAELTRLRGTCDEAEREAVGACDELRTIMQREFGWPLTELGLARLQRGDLDGAEAAFVEALETGWEPQPGLALLHLARGDAETAVASITAALDAPPDIPWKERPPRTELRRAPLLAVQVEACVAAADPDQARRAARELDDIAGQFPSPGLRASADASLGLAALAAGDIGDACGRLGTAVRGWSALGVPYEAARVRLHLADACAAAGDRQRAEMERRAARSTAERIGASLLADRAAAALDGRPRTPERGDRPDAAFTCDGDYWSATYAGRTVRLRGLKGFGYLARLLAEPARELHVLDLAAGRPSPLSRATGVREVVRTSPGSAAGAADAGPLLDDRAKDEYRRRLADIDDDIAEAEAFGDGERAARAALERDFLVRELARAVGLDGRDRRAGSDVERARVAVTRAIRRALDAVDEHHPQLGAHLHHSVRTGTYCAYEPDPELRIAWHV